MQRSLQWSLLGLRNAGTGRRASPNVQRAGVQHATGNRGGFLRFRGEAYQSKASQSFRESAYLFFNFIL